MFYFPSACFMVIFNSNWHKKFSDTHLHSDNFQPRRRGPTPRLTSTRPQGWLSLDEGKGKKEEEKNGL